MEFASHETTSPCNVANSNSIKFRLVSFTILESVESRVYQNGNVLVKNAFF